MRRGNDVRSPGMHFPGSETGAMNAKNRNYKTACEEFRDKVGAFREGTLDESEHLKLEAHRVECGRCRRALREEERVSLLMAEVRPVEVSPDFRDRVLRAWRLRRDRVKEQVPVRLLNGLQIGMLVVATVLLMLPMVRLSLISSAYQLTSALDRLPPEYRQGIEVSFSIPTMAEINAHFQVWQGKIFESLGDVGIVLAPWTGWIWGALILSVLLAAVSVWRVKSIIPLEKRERA